MRDLLRHHGALEEDLAALESGKVHAAVSPDPAPVMTHRQVQQQDGDMLETGDENSFLYRSRSTGCCSGRADSSLLPAPTPSLRLHTAPGPHKPWIIFLDPGGADRLHQVGGLQAELQAVRDAVLAADAGLLQPGTVSHLSSVMIS